MYLNIGDVRYVVERKCKMYDIDYFEKNIAASNMPEYSCWLSILTKCTRKNSGSFKYFGEKGIRMDERWINSFWAFLRDVGLRPSLKHRIARKNTSGHFNKENCYWALPEEVIPAGTKIYVDVDGKKMTLGQAAKYYGVSTKAVYERWRNGKDISVGRPEERTYVLNGTIYKWRDLKDISKVSLCTFKARLDMGWDILKALNTPVHTDEIYPYKGKHWNIPSLVEEFGLTVNQWRYYLSTAKKSVEEIINEIINKETKYFHKGAYRTLSEISKLEGIDYHKLKLSIDTGVSISKILKNMGVSESKGLTIKYQSRVMLASEFSKLTGLPNRVVRRWIHAGRTAEEMIARHERAKKLDYKRKE